MTRMGALAAALVVVAPAVAVVLMRGGGRPAPQAGEVLPWLGQPADQPYQVVSRSARPAAERCAGAVLGTMWSDGGTLLIGNSGSTRCTLSGRPEVTAVDVATGRRTTVAAVALPQSPDAARQYPATVDPGEPARVDIDATATCASPGRYRDAQFEVDGRAYPLPGIDVSCPVSVSEWYLQPPLLNTPLSAVLNAPATARAGQPLDYTVTVVNGQGHDVTLEPCPQVRESLGDSGGLFRLNCAPRRLAAHSRTTFAATITAPAHAGTARLRWMLVMPDGTVCVAGRATDRADVAVTA